MVILRLIHECWLMPLIFEGNDGQTLLTYGVPSSHVERLLRIK